MCSYIGLCVDCNSFVRRNFPAICCSAGCRVAFGLRCISSLELQTCLILSVCHCGVATFVNVVREPQVAFTLQPYLWLASWNEHSPYCMRAHTEAHTNTHLSLEAWRSPVEHICLETGPSGPPGEAEWAIYSLYVLNVHILKCYYVYELTLGYLSIFSFICDSLRDLVISGASSKNFLKNEGQRETHTELQWNELRNKKQVV